ncbi:MAG: dATP/dGTP diphosphohydrolase domain-containing protein [Betaproteobacteria bacterium]
MNNDQEQLGRKYDTGKLDYTLVPFEGLDEIVKVLMFGARKYARDNWRYVPEAKQRYAAAAFRHMTAFNKGEQVDPETGISHLAHVGCCILFMLALQAPAEDKGAK